MASGPMTVTVPLPDLLAFAGRAKQAARAATQEYRTLAAEIKKAQAAGQAIGSGKIERLAELERIVNTQKQILKNSRDIKETVRDITLVKGLLGARLVKDLMSGKFTAADLVQDAAFLATSGVGRKLIQKAFGSQGGNAARALSNALPAAAIAGAITNEFFEGKIAEEKIREESAKTLGQTLDLGRDNFLDAAISRKIRGESFAGVNAAKAKLKEMGYEGAGNFTEWENAATKAGHSKVVQVLRGRKFFDKIADAGSLEQLSLMGEMSEKQKLDFMDSILAAMPSEVIKARLSNAEETAAQEARKARLIELEKTPSMRFRETAAHRLDEIAFQRRRGVVPLRYGD